MMIEAVPILLLLLGQVFSLISGQDKIGAKLECGVPGRPLLGDFEPVKERYDVGERVRYACSFDWLVGHVERTCGSDAKWSGSVPVCVTAVRLASSLQVESVHGSFLQQRHVFLDGNEATCTNGYSCGGLLIWITFTNPTALKGVIFTFPESKYPKFNVSTMNVKGLSQTLCFGAAPIKNQIFETKGSMPRTKVLYRCFSREIASGLLLKFEHWSSCYVSLCEVTFYPEPSDSKCYFPDTPRRGNIEQIPHLPNKRFRYSCASNLELVGFNMTSCRPNRTWSNEAPVCSEKLSTNTTDFQSNETNLHLNATDQLEDRRHRKHSLIFIYGSVTGAVVALLLVGLAIFVYFIRRKRRRKASHRTSLYRSSSQRSNSFDMSFRRNRHERRASSNNYAVTFSEHGQQRHEHNEGPRSDIPDLLGNGVRMKGLTNSAIGHIYADPIYLEVENQPAPGEQRTSNIKMAENDLYCPKT